MSTVDNAVIAATVAVVFAVFGVYLEHRRYVRRFTVHEPGRHRVRAR